MPLFYESIKKINFFAGIAALEKNIKFDLEAHLPNRQAVFISNGEYNLSTKKLSAQNSLSNIPLAEYLKLFFPESAINLSKGAFSASKLQITYEHSIFNAHGDMALNNAVLFLDAQKKITGNMQTPDIQLTWHNKQLSGK